MRYLAARCKEIMQPMGPDRMTVTEELGPYNVHTYQSTHCTGGAIMGDSPDNSVTNKYGQVWDTPNVFVTGAALYPQNPGANPTDTLARARLHDGRCDGRDVFRSPERDHGLSAGSAPDHQCRDRRTYLLG